MSAEAIVTVSAAVVALTQILKWSGAVRDAHGPLVVLGLALLGVLLWDGHLVVLANPTGHSSPALGSINTYVSYSLWVVVLGSVIVLLMDAWKLRRGEQRRAA